VPGYSESNLYRQASLLVYTFGVAAFSGLFALWVRQVRGGSRELRGWAYPGLFLYSAGWFALNLWTLEFYVLLAAACAFPFLLAGFFRVRGVIPLGAAGALLAGLSLLHHYTVIVFAHPLRDLGGAFCVLLGIACGLVLRRNPAGVPIFTILTLAAIVVPLAIYTDSDWLSLAMRSLPLSVLVVDSYARRRFIFFDLFVKWGAWFALALATLVVAFEFLPRSLHPLNMALLMLPVMGGVVWLGRKLGQAIDRHVLGRRYDAPGAQRLFVEGLQGTGSEGELLEEAARLVSRIFGAQGRIEAGPPCRLDLAPRQDGKPYFSQDLDLLRSLERVLGMFLENRRLEAKRRDLALEASRSELKALRAQINPHFLFNALNAVAGLIPVNPRLAEETVERLAEVFRYSLRRSEEEWVTLGDEAEFVRALLAVEQARYGERLRYAIEIAADVAGVKIPAMSLQVLVENALKHGVARSLEPCEVRVRAQAAGHRLMLEVADGGPGPLEVRPGGHGLDNVRRRLAGYYGEAARLTLERPEPGAETIARIELPL
jgi:hypothetical protein